MTSGDARDDSKPSESTFGFMSPHVSRRLAICSTIGAGIAFTLPSKSLALGLPAEAQTQILPHRFDNRDAWIISNDRLRIGVLIGGGFIGELSLVGADPGAGINVMRVPHYPTIDPFTFDLQRDGPRYGVGMQRKLMSGYMGHFVAFPHFGASSDSEFAQDYGQHGELIAVQWSRNESGQGDKLSMSAQLPLTQYQFKRTITLPRGQSVAYVSETATSEVAFDRPFQWVQHITFGPPFIEPGKNFVDTSPSYPVENRGGSDLHSPMAIGAQRDGSALPFTGETRAWQLSAERSEVYLTIYNPDLGLLIGYVFDAASKPWLLDWQEFHRNQFTPWDGRGVARGLCIGNSFIGGLQSAVRQRSLEDTPVYGWFDAKGTVERNYMIFAIPIDTDFQGVADLRMLPECIKITERRTNRTIEILHRGDCDMHGIASAETRENRETVKAVRR